jgi:hypothetical protein
MLLDIGIFILLIFVCYPENAARTSPKIITKICRKI